MICPHCGAEIIKGNVKTCPDCGKPIGKLSGAQRGNSRPASSNRGNSGTKKKHTGLWAVLVLLIIFGIIGSSGDKKSTSTTKSTGQTSTQTTQKSEPVETENVQPTIEPVDVNVDDSVEPDNTAETEEYILDLETLAVIWRLSLSQNFGENNYELEYDDTGVTINVWGDNVALGAASAAAGNNSAKESWDYMVDSQKILCSTISEQIEDAGIENYYVMLNVLNDMDKSKTLLSILNGVVIYDSVND